MDSKIINILGNNWTKKEGCEDSEISRALDSLNLILPTEYLDYIKWSNGGEGYIGKNYLSIWAINDVKQLNEDYGIQEFLSPDCLAIGTDGGDVCYGFDFSKNAQIFQSPLGDLDYSEIKYVGASFFSFLESLKST